MHRFGHTLSLNSISFQFGWFVMSQVSGWLQVRFGEFGFVPIFFSVATLYIVPLSSSGFSFIAGQSPRFNTRW
jgi:hypothetical protein